MFAPFDTSVPLFSFTAVWPRVVALQCLERSRGSGEIFHLTLPCDGFVYSSMEDFFFLAIRVVALEENHDGTDSVVRVYRFNQTGTPKQSSC